MSKFYLPIGQNRDHRHVLWACGIIVGFSYGVGWGGVGWGGVGWGGVGWASGIILGLYKKTQYEASY